MARLRYNGLTGTLGAAHNDSTTTLTLASKLTYEGGDVPSISGDNYLPLSILDSDGNCAEIVHVTAYTSAATTATITRGAEGTVASAHSDGSSFVNGPTVYEFAPYVGYLDTKTDDANLTTYTFSSVNLGQPFRGREIIVGIMSRAAATGRTLSSVTIAGETATIDATEYNSADGSTTTVLAFARAKVDGALSDSIVVTFSAQMVRCAMGVWASDREVDLQDSESSRLVTDSFTLTGKAGGRVLCVSAFEPSAGATFTSPAIERYDAAIDTAATKVAVADQEVEGNSATLEYTFSSSQTWQAALAASYGL